MDFFHEQNALNSLMKSNYVVKRAFKPFANKMLHAKIYLIKVKVTHKNSDYEIKYQILFHFILLIQFIFPLYSVGLEGALVDCCEITWGKNLVMESKINNPPVCYPADHHQVHDEVGYSIPVTHHDGIGCSQIRLSLKHRHEGLYTNASFHTYLQNRH